jgi:hypothetical protein
MGISRRRSSPQFSDTIYIEHDRSISMSDKDGEFGDVFLNENANVSYIADRLTECIRNCMRAIASQDAGSASYRAAEDFKLVLSLLVRSKSVGIQDLFNRAVAELTPRYPEISGAENRYQRRILNAAESGLQLLVETTCKDNAARGRTAKREASFLSSIEQIEEARVQMVSEGEAQWRKVANRLPNASKKKGKSRAAEGR